jgi:Xaa-Pro dipeptidase
MNAEARLEKLRSIMRRAGIDFVGLIPSPNLRYLTGKVHYVNERPIMLFIPLDDQPVAVIPKLEVPLFSQHPIECRIFSWADAEGYDQAFQTAFDSMNVTGKTIGVDGLNVRFFEGEIIRQHAPGATVIGVDEHLAEMRIIKDDDEIAALRKAIQISEQALQMTLDTIKVGMSEREIADQLETHLKTLGSEELSFNTIMHGGGNTALPHTGPLGYRIQPGDPLLFDFGGVHQGYRADITRTVFFREPSDDFRAFYEVVKTANATARGAACPGIKAEDVDRATNQVLIDAGYEHLIRHRTGHGLGLEAHEWPYIVEGNERILQPGMVFTVEPGIYQLDVIGVRIEDDVLITADGAESLSTFPRDIMIVG